MNLTKTQRQFLTKYLGECWHIPIPYSPDFKYKIYYKCSICGKRVNKGKSNRTFTDPKDKQDLLEAINKHGEWIEFEIQAMFLCPLKQKDFTKWLLLLSPLETAELICKWKDKE